MFDIIYLHIGLDKTGTKAIQCCCYENTTALNNAGIFYPITPDTVWHAELASYFHKDPNVYAYNQAIGRSDKALLVIQTEDLKYLRNLEKKIQQTDAQTMVLSYEGFAFLDFETLKKMHQYLSGLCKRIKVILYCREPIAYAISAVSQRAISMSPLWDSVPIQCYKTICEKFITIFGDHNMIVNDFSKSLLAGDIRSDFLHKIGFNHRQAPLFKLSASAQNASLCTEAIMIAVSLRKRCQQEQIPEAEFSWRYAAILQKINGTTHSLSTEQRRQVYQYSQAHLQYLAEKFSIHFSDTQAKTLANSTYYSPDFIDSIADIIHHANTFTPPLIPEVKTEQALAYDPFVGQLQCLEKISSLLAEQQVSLKVKIVNQSSFNWLSKGLAPIYLSYHWQTELSETIIFEGLRSPLSTLGLRRGQSLEATLKLIAPLKTGHYYLILTLVKENVCWLEDHGFKPARISIKVV
jgi:hypothetical protein